MNFVNSKTRMIATIALVASLECASSKGAHAEEASTTLTLPAIWLDKGRLLESPIGPAFPMVEYKYGGPAEFRISGPTGIVQFDKLREGLALPVVGTVYEVTRAGHDKVEFTRVSEAELAPEMKLKSGSYVLPTLSTGGFKSWQFKVERIATVDGEPRVTIQGFFPGQSMTGTYRPGESINANGSLHRIVSIVPPQGKFTGWVEFDSVARDGPPAAVSYLEVADTRDRLEIHLLPTRSPELRGRAVLYRDAQQRQEAIDFLVAHKGIAVPFLGKVYRVTEANTKHILCERVPNDKLPPNSAHRDGSYLLPLDLTMTVSDWDARVTEITVQGNERTAKIVGFGPSEGKFGTYKLGDDIIFNGITHRILNIVPTNEAKTIVGWVEITPTPPEKLFNARPEK